MDPEIKKAADAIMADIEALNSEDHEIAQKVLYLGIPLANLIRHGLIDQLSDYGANILADTLTNLTYRAENDRWPWESKSSEAATE